MPQLTAKELEAHPEFPHVMWDLKPTKKGKVAAAKGRGGPVHIAYEIHGHGPRLMVLVMGLGGMKSSWQRQTKDFGHTRGDRYSVLVVDNRGIGESDKPLARYSTSEMAKDVVEVLDAVGWDRDRSLHVVGISLGGMIAQEMALLIPTRISSLSLISTAARLRNTVGFFENLYQRASLFIPKPIDTQIANNKASLYTPAFIAGPDVLEPTVQPFPTAGDRVGAGELTKRRNTLGHFTKAGFISQAVAAGWHHKSPQQLADLAGRVDRERIWVLHGREDRMITFPHAEELVRGLSGGPGEEVPHRFVEGQGHVIPIEMREQFAGWVEERFDMWEGK